MCGMLLRKEPHWNMTSYVKLDNNLNACILNVYVCDSYHDRPDRSDENIYTNTNTNTKIFIETKIHTITNH